MFVCFQSFNQHSKVLTWTELNTNKQTKKNCHQNYRHIEKSKSKMQTLSKIYCLLLFVQFLISFDPKKRKNKKKFLYWHNHHHRLRKKQTNIKNDFFSSVYTIVRAINTQVYPDPLSSTHPTITFDLSHMVIIVVDDDNLSFFSYLG